MPVIVPSASASCPSSWTRWGGFTTTRREFYGTWQAGRLLATTNDEDGRQAAGTSAIMSVITHGVPGSLF